MTFLAEVIFSGFVSKAVNNCVDVSWNKIKDAVRNRKVKYQNLESQIYCIIVDVLNKITYFQFENNQDNIYDAAEVLLKSFHGNDGDRLSNIKSGLQVLQLDTDKNECLKFKMLIYEELGKNDYSELYRAILLFQLEQKNQYDYIVYEQLNRKLDELLAINQKKDSFKNKYLKKNPISRTQEYADKWEANMFLNDFDKRDENSGVNVKLSEVYLDEHLPHYIWGNNLNERFDLKDLLSEYVYERNENKMLLILGQPGIGKSTLITWLLNNFTDINSRAFVFRFASDLNNIDWQNIDNGNDIWKKLIENLELENVCLQNKILIIDGFDEISNINNRENIINKLYWGLLKERSLNNMSLMITCREHYLQDVRRIECNYITLQPWDRNQIESFFEIYQKITNNFVSFNFIDNIIEKEDILEIPLILYMVLALDININDKSSIVDVYDQIFSLKNGGIYERCIQNSRYEIPHRISKIKEKIHQISREIAIWMFENNSDEAYIPQIEYYKICVRFSENDENENNCTNADFMIGNFFKLVRHCDGVETEKLYFIHRSIYEYFVAETIYNSIENALLILSEKGQEEFAGNIALYLKKGQITYTICEYLVHKILKLYKTKLDKEKRKCFYQWLENAVGTMMSSGMLYYSKKNILDFKDIMSIENTCFVNLMRILRKLQSINHNIYIMEDIDFSRMTKYVKNYLLECEINSQIVDLSKMFLEKIKLRGLVSIKINFSEVNLEGADLSYSNLIGANFKGANLKKSNLTKANLRGAHLEGADLRGADLFEVSLENAILENAIFDDYVIQQFADRIFDLKNIKVYFKSTGETISYKEFQERFS